MKKIFQKAAIAAALALPLVASADAILFDMDGAGGSAAYTVDLLDWTVGNALAVNGNPNTGLIAGSQTQLLYQANLGIVSLGGGFVAAAGSGTNQTFSVVAGFNEVVLASSTATNINFGFADTAARDASNFFYVYANTFGNNLAGTGFVGGNLVMSGYISNVVSSNYAVSLDPITGLPVIGLFDQNGTDQYAGKQTLVGSGTSDVDVKIDFYDTNYFSGLNIGEILSLSFTNTSQLTPFKQVDPSLLFSSTGLVSGDLASNIGTINGVTEATTRNFQLQADGNSSFRTTSVPEPGSLALVGLALGAAGFIGRRSSKKA
jgi:hypothetical protein